MNLLEIELVKLAKKGDKKALEEIFLMEKEYLYKCAFLYTKNRDDALDLVQNSIIKCLLHIKELKKPEHFRTWMTKIIINCANSEYARQNKYVLQEEEEIFYEDSRGISTEEKIDLYHAIDCLKYPYKEIIVQYYFANSKLDEIAEILDMPIGTVKAYHARAKRKMREMLEVEV